MSAAYLGSFFKAKVAIVEKGKMGGDCLHTGCIPSKSIINISKVIHNCRAYSKEKIINCGVKVNFPNIMKKVHKTIRAVQPHDSVERYEKLGVDCYKGEATIVGRNKVKVGKKILTTKNIIIATGSRPRVINFKGLEKSNYYTSDNIWSLKKLPKEMVVIGAGAIGCELAQTFAKLGTKVKLIQRDKRILEREDPEVSSLIEKTFKKEGIEVLKGCNTLEFGKNYGIFEHKGKKKKIKFDVLLLSLGRVPDTSLLKKSKLEFKLNKRGGLKVDRYLRTNHKNIFACGDITTIMQLTNMAHYQAIYATINALSFSVFRINYDIVPWAIFIEPEIARVGLNELEAKKLGIKYKSTFYDLSRLDRNIIEDKRDGFIKIITKGNSDKILGTTIVGFRAAEMINEFTLGMKHKLGLSKILNTLHIYPTLSEANIYAAGAWRRSKFSSFMLKLFEKFNKFRRGDDRFWM